MRYYCTECKSEINSEYDLKWCPMCDYHTATMPIVKIPDFETPSQYEKRTEKKWNGAVWVKWIKTDTNYIDWVPTYAKVNSDQNLIDLLGIVYTLCANSPEPPPDDYLPQENY